MNARGFAVFIQPFVRYTPAPMAPRSKLPDLDPARVLTRLPAGFSHIGLYDVRTRKAFAVTEVGRAELAGKTDELKVIVARLTSLAQAGEREASPPVRRAFANLALALRQRVAAGEFDNATALAVADILDEAARKIERL